MAGNRLDGDCHFALAVSGGPDSLALLLLSWLAMPGRFQVATVDHQLRRESAEEAQLVGAICSSLGVVHTTLAVTLAEGNLQEQAREARYAALAKWSRERGLKAILTAHHADDQVETLVMRLNRGSGVRGLAGIRPRGTTGGDKGVAVIRPLLNWRKSELTNLVTAAGLVPAHDPTNRDERFERARIRAHLAKAEWLDPLALSRSAQHLAEAEEALDWVIADICAREVKRDGRGIRWTPREYPAVIVQGVIDCLIAECGGRHASAAEVARLYRSIGPGGQANLAGVLVRHDKGKWHFAPEPERRRA